MKISHHLEQKIIRSDGKNSMLEEIRKELQEEKENIEVRIKSLEKIENRLINSLKEYEKKLGEKSERGNETESS